MDGRVRRHHPAVIGLRLGGCRRAMLMAANLHIALEVCLDGLSEDLGVEVGAVDVPCLSVFVELDFVHRCRRGGGPWAAAVVHSADCQARCCRRRLRWLTITTKYLYSTKPRSLPVYIPGPQCIYSVIVVLHWQARAIDWTVAVASIGLSWCCWLLPATATSCTVCAFTVFDNISLSPIMW